MTLKYLIQKEFLQIRRNAFLPRLIVLFPVVIMCVTPWIMNMEVRNVKVEVVDNDRSALSRQIVNSIAASKYFIFNGQRDTYNEALEDIELSKTDIILVIPKKFGRDMDLGIRRQVLIAANAVNGTKGAIGSIYLSQIVTEKADPDVEALQKKVTSLFLYNKKYDFKLFMIPALFAIVMMLMTGYLPALNIVGEKEAGTIEQINVTPVSKLMFILAKLIPYWVIALIDFSICLLLAWFLYGIMPVGSIALLFVFAIALAIVFSSIGLIISNYSDSLQQAMLVMWFALVCMMLLSGLFTPVRSMPDWAQILTYANPVRHYMDAARTIFIRGSAFSGVVLQFSILAAMGIILASLAVKSYKKNE